MSASPVIRVISDLHLGHPGCRIDAVEQLRPLLEGADRAVFNGDTVELRHRLLIEKGRRMFGQLRSLLDELAIEATWLTGNHDPEISTTHSTDLADGRVFVFHGDAMFRYLSPWSPRIRKVIPAIEEIRASYGEDRLANDLEAALDCCGRCRALVPAYEHEFRRGPLKHLRTAIRFAWPPHRPVQILSNWMAAPGLAHRFAERYRPAAGVVLFGHTHFTGLWGKAGRIAINTGGFVAMLPARIVEIRDGTLTCRRIEESHAGFRMGDAVASFALA